MITEQTLAPPVLQYIQEWFGSIIARPIDFDNRMNPVSPCGHSMEKEAAHYIAPSPTLRPAQRIELYNQQYWWRLLNVLHEVFPFVTCLFGYREFNQVLGFPFLVKYPPAHWFLQAIGDRLPLFVQKYYRADDFQLVYDATQLDCAFNQAFYSAHIPTNLQEMMLGDSEAVLAKSLVLQPHMQVFAFKYDLVEFRQAFLKQNPDYWLEHDFPELKHVPTFCAVFRNDFNQVVTTPLDPDEYHFLSLFRSGCSIDQACEWLDEQTDPIFENSAENLQKWFHKWFLEQWLTLDTKSSIE
ncbi:putative uncharacterized protein [Parachlamydia acanthamoebae UV-7]|jgi:hypothetical protein|uniref:Putative DNA-binding domain-containing protein n=2 Tax=Parachlamydia acanthamoebae TaxID=83552 RepID=F8KW01_PARAV|nr:putative DNA-binding domain-containing protein [Parachlamydia acanthamoebae]EFB41231.1 hypothetical protein pah_c048o055 [Parachlamydia acanthamoebae str. Hall's coccus]CCB85074.1 putative uncharacterized protein [Parachlamydia acanthamoebae UV-7]